MWTEACDGLDKMIDAFDYFDSYDEESKSNNLSKKISYKMRKNLAKYAALTSALMQKPTAAAIDSESAGFDTGAAATGFGIGLVGFLAVAGIAKMLRREQSSKAIYELKDIEELLFQVVGFAASGFFEGKASSSQRKHK